LRWKDFRIKVDVNHQDVTYTIRDGPHSSLSIRHAGEDLELRTDKASTVVIRPCEPLLPEPQQPPGREPLGRKLR
jgi:trehalose/maltose hydrolase-like predicted phosphorylase